MRLYIHNPSQQGASGTTLHQYCVSAQFIIIMIYYFHHTLLVGDLPGVTFTSCYCILIKLAKRAYCSHLVCVLMCVLRAVIHGYMEGEVACGVGDDHLANLCHLGPHLGTTLGDHIWGPYFGTTFGGPRLGDHTWGPHFMTWGPHLGTTLRPPLIALFLKLCIFDILKYFLMSWRTFYRHNVPLDVLFDIIIYLSWRTLLT